MARKRIKMKKMRDILRLKETANLSERQIARALNISRPVVAKYWREFQRACLKYEQIKDMPDSKLIALLDKPIKNNDKHKTLIAFFPYCVKELTRKGVTIRHLWLEYKQHHPDGYMYSQFCYHFQIWKNASEVRMRIKHKAGDKMFVDYAGTKMTYIDGKTMEKKEAECFIAILGCSGLTYAEASNSQEKNEWIRSNERALWYFGGVPQAIVPDNLRSAVSKSDPYEPGINPTYDSFAEHYGTVIIPARVRKARDKALVENAVRLVYQRIYAPLRNRTFYSIEELNLAIQDMLGIHNNTNFQRLNYSRRDLFESTEHKALKTLPAEKYKMMEIAWATVQINYHVELREDRHYYSVPFFLRKRGKKIRVKLVYDDRTVAIYYDNVRITQHLRDRTPNDYTTEASHMPPNHRLYAEWSPKRLINWAESYGHEVVKVVERMIASRKHPEQAFKVCLGLLNLGKKYGEWKLSKACRQANSFGIHSLKQIISIIKLLEEDEKQPKLDLCGPLPAHENIRGSNYYKTQEIGANYE